jgi:hypothetical protein
MEASAFSSILAGLVLRVPGAHAAALVDREGETVDYTGPIDPFEIKVAAAELRLLLDHEGFASAARPEQITVRFDRRSMIIRRLPEGYAIAMLLGRRAGFTRCTRAFEVCAHALADEAAWPAPPHVWLPVDVACDPAGRPAAIADLPGERRVEVIGAVMGLPGGERGYRVRTEPGVELTLVREPGGWWYADEPRQAWGSPAPG